MSMGMAPNIGGGLSLGACPSYCDPKFAPRCTNDCLENMAQQTGSPCGGTTAASRYTSAPLNDTGGNCGGGGGGGGGIGGKGGFTASSMSFALIPRYADPRYLPRRANYIQIQGIGICPPNDCDECPDGRCICIMMCCHGWCGHPHCCSCCVKPWCTGDGGGGGDGDDGGGDCGDGDIHILGGDMRPGRYALGGPSAGLTDVGASMRIAFANSSRVPLSIPCSPPPALRLPPAVPGSGSGFGAGVLPQRFDGAHFISICGLYVTCAETGVTLISDGNALQFYSSSSGTASFSTPGGPGGECPSSSGHTYSSGTAGNTFSSPDPAVARMDVTQTS